MGNQHETIIPSRLKYITLLSRQTNNSEVKSIVGFNTFSYDNTIDYFSVDMAHLCCEEIGIVLSAKLAKIGGFDSFVESGSRQKSG